MYSETKMTKQHSRKMRIVFAFAVTALGGCASPRALPPPVAPYDYRDRHPVVLAEAPYVLDLFPSIQKGRVDIETMGRIRELAERYKAFGQGQITLSTPSGGQAAKNAAASSNAVRRALASAGLGDVIATSVYHVADQKLAAPIRVSFQSLKAKVANPCGEWPRDLASGSSLYGWQNETYWNFGCANQSTLAAQVADPRDLANPRGQTPSDVEMRLQGITKLRRGEDPSTRWNLKGTNIGAVGGGQ